MKTFYCNGGTYSLGAMLDANADDAGLCEWLATAKVGERFDGGGVDCWRVS